MENKNYRKVFYIIGALILFTILPACSGGVAAQQPGSKQPADKQIISEKPAILETITADAAFEMIEKEAENPNFLILDIRTPAEFNEKQISGAINIDYYAADYKAQLQQLDRTKKILLYCRSGNRTGKTLPIMEELGFKEVYNLAGGIIVWETKNYPLVEKK